MLIHVTHFIPMNCLQLRNQIQTLFNGTAFRRPLFSQYQGGLRFELSEGRDYLHQFLTAHRKGMEICRALFTESDQVTLCVRIHAGKSSLSCLQAIRALREVRLFPVGYKDYWTEPDDHDETADGHEVHQWHCLAFQMPAHLLQNVLWCAFACDFGSIKPRVQALFYIFDFDREIMLFPYDDRGMDVVCPNKLLLKDLYQKFSHYLLPSERTIMDATFASMEFIEIVDNYLPHT
ncbi:MAG: DUF3885 domain-containing protein [Verrucomicrobiota bacterium]|nr:DUF3885 domain-containing protein [Verrucomicrobiota bacterium]